MESIMRFNIALSALGCLCLVLPVVAAEAETEFSPALRHEPVLGQYQKFEQGAAAAPVQPHAEHDMHHDHAEHDMHHDHAGHEQHQHATQHDAGQRGDGQHDGHHRMHGE
uniref:Uncharacterized protein n=1 Tax=uncultured marine microorganism HF4000_ANIW137K11 TaxID=455533 RepID=B3T4U5_9ZZZZ|nr:hypothetical protein ALOHA_HF4000ANIW137K11ctg4g5 [uncultured marine microorganism HF4000_ANIW137K11]